ncbi:MAG: PAN domain-containing protein [Elusimicrobia bacterium]|nr:PAN domain-containing protein [Elusimicrobiota bacterium]
MESLIDRSRRGSIVLVTLLLAAAGAQAAERPPARNGPSGASAVIENAQRAHDELDNEKEELGGGKPARAKAAVDAKGEPAGWDESPDADADMLSPEEQRERSYHLIKDGAGSIAKQVLKTVLKEVVPKSFKIVLPLGVKLDGPVDAVDKGHKLYKGIKTGGKYNAEHAEEGDGVSPGLAYGLALSYEFLAPTPIKMTYAAGKIMIGTGELAFEDFTEKYLEARANRLLIDKGGFWERYSNFRSEGTTPFYLWGVAKQRGLKEDLGNLSQVFTSPGELTAAWDRYAAFMRDFGGRQHGAVREDFDAETGKARDILLEEWSEQVKMDLARRVKDCTERALPEVEGNAAELLARYRHAMRIILETKDQAFTLQGRARGLRPASMKDRGLLVKIDGSGVERNHVIRALGTVKADGTYSLLVRGIRPRMSTVTGYAGKDGAKGTYRHVSKPAALPVFPRLFETFDRDRWAEVNRPPDEIELDLDFGDAGPEPDKPGPADECADLDPSGKGLEKGAFYTALARHQKCLKEGRAAVAAQPPAGGGVKPVVKPAAAAKFRVYLFRIWPPDKPKEVGHVLYVRIEETGRPGLFKFPDGNGGWYWRVGEASGPHQDEESVCAVLRGYGQTSVSYNLGWAPHINCAKEGPTKAPELQQPKGQPTREEGVNRGGGDYRDLDLPSADPELCRQECAKDARCWAYTYVKPGVQGSKARCWLKSGIPSAAKDDCCVSGVRP